MNRMKYYLMILFLLGSFNLSAQRIKPFGGFSLYRNVGFENSAYGGVHAGAEFKINKYIRPEIETSFLFGKLENSSKLDDIGNVTDLFERKVHSINFSFSPKISLGENDEGDSYISIRPKYNFSKIQASGTHSIVNQSNPTKSVQIQDNYTEWLHSLGIGIGFHIYVSDKNSNTIAFILYYQGIQMGNALSQLKFSNENYTTKDVLGIGVTYYIGVKNKE
jgi:hypothetical protein